MLTNHQIRDLLTLVRHRFPDWRNFDHPPFVADEIAYKQTAVAQAQELLNRSTLDTLIAQGDTDTFLSHLETSGRATNLLWLRVPKASDLAVLHHPQLHPAEFCTQMRNLLYGDQPTPQRLQHFSDYLEHHSLPNGWPFATYFLFLSNPAQEMFVKPHAATWLLKYLGYAKPTVTRPPNATTYANVVAAAQTIAQALAPYGATDMIAIQSFVWVCYRESKARVGRLSPEGQIALDVPRAEDEPAVEEEIAMEKTAVLQEPPPSYSHTNPHPRYTLADCATDTGIPADTLAVWLAAIRRKGQAIFYGPPGTGKTFLAQKLAQHLISDSQGEIELVQFHPAYSYEEFIQGLRPVSQLDGSLRYELVSGRFLQFCERANASSAPHVFIIDEINRANLAAVFGELMYLLEYRDAEIGLAANGRLRLPQNLYLIGTMNTADRSIALVDYALRRRFAFIHLQPNYDLLRQFHAARPTNPTLVQRLITLLQRLNTQINDPSYQLGPSYFLQDNLADLLPTIWQLEIEPYLEEYFFDQPQQVASFRWTAVSPTLLPTS